MRVVIVNDKTEATAWGDLRVDLSLQRRGMTAFAIAVRMTRAHLAGQRSDGAGSLSAVFAGVFRGFIALIESVSALTDSVRMT